MIQSKNKFKYVLIVVMFLWGIIGMAITTHAQAYNSFVTSADIPNNQVNKKVSYFDLKITENHSQTLTIAITNKGNETMIANVKINNATTADDGGIVYIKKEKADSSLKTPLSEFVKVKTPKLEIAAGKTKTASIRINAKDLNFNGVLLGGITVSASTEKETSNNDSSLQIENEVAYVTALQLRMNSKKVDTNLNLISVKGALSKYKTSVNANIQNNQPIIMKGAKITGSIYKKDSDKTISTVDLRKVDIAPNSNFNVIYDWSNNKLENGDYRIKMRAEHNGKVWEWDENFKIDNAQEVNSQAFELNGSINYVLVGAIAGLVLVTGLLFLYKRKRKKEEDK